MASTCGEPEVHTPMLPLPRFPSRSAKRLAAAFAFAFVLLALTGVSPVSALPLHPIGDPSPDEVLIVELINRARLSSTAEATRVIDGTYPSAQGLLTFFAVDIPLFQAQMAALPSPLQPLAFQSSLDWVSGLHSQDMVDNDFFGHISSASPPAPLIPNGTIGDRLAVVGYSGLAASENVVHEGDATAAHANFLVDPCECPSTGGMQTPAGHRGAIFSSAFSEVGIGVHPKAGMYGPLIAVTENFGDRGLTYLTGIAILDVDDDDFYDIDEGLGGVEVTVAGASFDAETTDSGAWAVPVPGDGAYTVTFSAPFMADDVSAVVVSGGNEKHDLILDYFPPVMTGSLTPTVGEINAYAISPVPAATNYQVNIVATQPALDLFEGAEPGEQNVLITTDGGYDIVQSERVYSGSNAYRLWHYTGNFEAIELDVDIEVRSDTALSFQHQLGFAAPTTAGKVEISVDGGTTWTELVAYYGTDDFNMQDWEGVTVPLGAYAGTVARIRFAYDGGGYCCVAPDISWAWKLDHIELTNFNEVVSDQVVDLGPVLNFDFIPASPGNYRMRARPEHNGRFFPYGDLLDVVAAEESSCSVYRWRFDETAAPAPSGTTAVEDNCGAHGTVLGLGAAFTGGGISLPGGGELSDAGYVDLPNGLVSALDSATFEIWYSIDSAMWWSRLFDFGSSGGNEVPPAPIAGNQFYIGYRPTQGWDIGLQDVSMNDGFSTGGVHMSEPTSLATIYHVAVTFEQDGAGAGLHQLSFYRDGVLIDQTTTTAMLENLNDVNNWLGRSNSGNEWYFDGTIDEFRLYHQALTGPEVAASFANGPDVPTVAVPEPGMGASLLAGVLLLETLRRRRLAVR